MPVPGFQRPGGPVLDEGLAPTRRRPAPGRRPAISEAKGGGDPAAARDVYRKAPTMKQLGKRFLEEYVRDHCPSARRTGGTLRSVPGRRRRRDRRTAPQRVCGRPLQCKQEFEQLVTCGQALSYVRPLKCGMHAPRAHMVFVDRIQIASAVCFAALRAVLVFPTPPL